MDTLQSICLAILDGVTQFIPVSESAHHLLIPYFFGWPTPGPALIGAMSAGSLLALLVYFRHDWASIISSGLRVIFTGRRPMMLDERMPFFIVLTILPTAIGWYYLHERMAEVFDTPIWVAGILLATCIPLWFSESMNRRNKTMSFWNWKDSLLIGVSQLLLLFPGAGRQAGAFSGACLLNYNREAAYKFSFYSFAPVLAAKAFLNLHEISLKDSAPASDLTWLSFWVALVVTFFVGCFTLSYLMKNLQNKGMAGVIAYRIALAALAFGVYWVKNR